MVNLKCVDECAASSLNERLVESLAERDKWKSLAIKFANACEIDGFGDVRDAHYGELSKALKDFKELKNV